MPVNIFGKCLNTGMGWQAMSKMFDWVPKHPLRNAVRKKTGLCGKNSQVADPLPPVWEFSHFFTVFLKHFYAIL